MSTLSAAGGGGGGGGNKGWCCEFNNLLRKLRHFDLIGSPAASKFSRSYLREFRHTDLEPFCAGEFFFYFKTSPAIELRPSVADEREARRSEVA